MSDKPESSDPDDGFSIFRGPANWFSLAIPDELQIEQNEAFLEVTPREENAVARDGSGKANNPQQRWSLTLYAAWVEEDEPETHSTSFSPASLFPGLIKSERGDSLSIAAKNRSWRGMSLKSTGPWWRKLFQRKNTYEWRLWIIEHQQIIVVASLQSAVSFPLADSIVQQCTTLLNSISFAERLALPPELFRAEVVGLAQKHFPLLDVEKTGTFGIRLNDSEIHLTNFYRSYLHTPERLKQIVLPGLTTVVRMQEWGPDQLMPDLSTVSDRIMPMLYPEVEADSSLEDFVKVPWVAGLSIMFVLDEDDTYRFVHSSMMESWQATEEELRDLAMKNLESYARDNPLEVSVVGEDGDARMLIPVNPNAYNSVRLLGGQLHMRLRQLLGAELVVGIPNRDFFVAVSLNHPQLVGQIRQQVAQDFHQMHHPLTSRLLVISADGVSEYCED